MNLQMSLYQMTIWTISTDFKLSLYVEPVFLVNGVWFVHICPRWGINIYTPPSPTSVSSSNNNSFHESDWLNHCNEIPSENINLILKNPSFTSASKVVLNDSSDEVTVVEGISWFKLFVYITGEKWVNKTNNFKLRNFFDNSSAFQLSLLLSLKNTDHLGFLFF